MILFSYTNKYRIELSLLAITISMVGLFYSKAMMSIGMILLGIFAVFNIKGIDNIIKLWKDKLMMLFVLYFLIHFISIIDGGDSIVWLERVRMKLPFMVFGLAFASMPLFQRKHLHYLLVIFLVLILISTLPLCFDMLVNYDDLKNIYSKGKVIATPVNHIRYSLMIAFATCVGAFLFLKQWSLKYKWEKWAYLITSFYCFTFLHLLAVRSGLVCLYSAAFILMIKYVIDYRKYKLGILLLSLFFIVPYFLITNINSLKKKFNYTIYTLEHINNPDKQQSMSDSKRQISWELGLNIVEEHVLFGVGVGNLLNEMDLQYDANYPSFKKENRIIPHNQFIYILATFGVFGGLIFVMLLLIPFLTFHLYKSYLFLLFMLIQVLSFVFEATLEGQLGIAFFLLFFFPLFHYFKYESKKRIVVV